MTIVKTGHTPLTYICDAHLYPYTAVLTPLPWRPAGTCARRLGGLRARLPRAVVAPAAPRRVVADAVTGVTAEAVATSPPMPPGTRLRRVTPASSPRGAAGQRLVARKERIRVESGRLSSIDPAPDVRHA
ncbi:hypothetical protein GCM10027162_60010 [Streptomyces incanus]